MSDVSVQARQCVNGWRATYKQLDEDPAIGTLVRHLEAVLAELERVEESDRAMLRLRNEAVARANSAEGERNYALSILQKVREYCLQHVTDPEGGIIDRINPASVLAILDDGGAQQ